MKKSKSTLLNSIFFACLGVMAFSAIAHAEETEQGDSWNFAADVYLWGADVGGETTRGDDIDVSFSDLMKSLELGFMGGAHAYHGKWHASMDVLYVKISEDNSGQLALPDGGELRGDAEVDLTTVVLTPVLGYTMIETERLSVEPFVGARYTSVDPTLKIAINQFNREFSDSQDVWDGIVGVRGDVNLDSNWHIPYYLDVGTGDTELTWQAMGGIGYRINQSIDIVAAYRYLEWQLDDNRVLDNLNLSGPLIGARFRF